MTASLQPASVAPACRDCAAFGGEGLHAGGSGAGTCRARPPLAGRGWPRVAAGDWCAFFRPRPVGATPPSARPAAQDPGEADA